MVSLFILVFASIALGRFAVSQWRTIWITAANQPLSDSLRVTAGIDDAAIGAQDFGSLLDLCDNLSPGLKTKTPWLKEVSVYYRAVAKLEQVSKLKLPSLSTWATREMKICSRYVAVVLDQNLAMNLDRRLAAASINPKDSLRSKIDSYRPHLSDRVTPRLRQENSLCE